MADKKDSNLEHTQFFNIAGETENKVREVLALVYNALSEKGYDPVSQIVGYVMSGDPTYVTSYKNARYLIMRVERDEILEELLKNYIENNLE
ncbi:MAG: IreB family regulatory phosphoprotein [Lachnospiraceae bacterium]|nr:IreB family regulatory phosphoprotein [Lachnospiraceae bacterium]